RIVGIAALDHMLGLAVALEMLLVDVVGHHPGRIVGLVADGPGAGRRSPIVAAESNWKSIYDRRMGTAARVRFCFWVRFGMTRLGIGGMRKSCFAVSPPAADRRGIKIVQAHLGD